MSQKPTSGAPGWRDTFRKYIPRWMQNRPANAGGNVFYRVLYSLFAPLDKATQAIVEGQRAQWPGVGTSTADNLIAQSRGLVQGENETAAAFEARAIGWLDAWTQNDVYATEQMLRQIQDYLTGFSPGGPPSLSTVDRQGHWVLLSSAGVASETTAAWNWDGFSNPNREPYWSDFWLIVHPAGIIVNPAPWALAGAIGGGRGAPSGSPGLGFGHLVTRAEVDAVRGIVSLWKGTHATLRTIIWAYDATLCLPGGGNNPDGWWGEWSKLSGGRSGTRVASRSSSGRYWDTTIL